MLPLFRLDFPARSSFSTIVSAPRRDASAYGIPGLLIYVEKKSQRIRCDLGNDTAL